MSEIEVCEGEGQAGGPAARVAGRPFVLRAPAKSYRLTQIPSKPPQKAGEGEPSFEELLVMRTLFVLAAIAALAHGAPHRDSHRELEPQTDAHAKRVPKPGQDPDARRC